MSKKNIFIATAAGVVLVLGGAGIALAVINIGDDDGPLTGEGLDRATAGAAALAAIGSGRVTDFDMDDDWDHVYEVEVTLDDGSDRDVELDTNFVVVRIDDIDQ